MVASVFAMLASAACLAAPVHEGKVRAGPFVGHVTPTYDVVAGRFRLHVGQYRVPGSLTQKIPWFVDRRYRVGERLVVTGLRLGGPPRTFRQTFARAYSADAPNAQVFPSIISPPTAGCWRLTFRTGSISGSLTVLVANRS